MIEDTDLDHLKRVCALEEFDWDDLIPLHQHVPKLIAEIEKTREELEKLKKSQRAIHRVLRESLSAEEIDVHTAGKIMDVLLPCAWEKEPDRE